MSDIIQRKETSEEKKRIADLLRQNISELDFTIRTQNCLKGANIMTVGSLVQFQESDLLQVRNMGKKSLSEIDEKIKSMGLSLGMNVEAYLPEYLFPFVRKGISQEIKQKDLLGESAGDEPLYRERASIEITAKIAAGISENDIDPQKKEEEKKIQENGTVISEIKPIKIVGPGDVLSINSNAVMNVSPANGDEGFSRDYYPYIEFWDPDFAWRYTPAAAKNEKLRPWIALVVCETSKCDIQKNKNGQNLVTFKISDDDEYKAIFPSKKEIWKAAHAQGHHGEKADFCRILGIRREGVSLREKTDYTAFLIPVFEVGRLRGIGCAEDKLKDVIAQSAAWEDDLKSQQQHDRSLSFPAYYSWSFKTGTYSFDTIVKNLQIYQAKKSGIDVDVTSLGHGFNYSCLKNGAPQKQTILMPAATKVPAQQAETVFPNPAKKDEEELFTTLKDLLSLSPVFLENEQARNKSENKHILQNEDDPWVVPPIYGGKHSMAKSLDQTETPEWVHQVNMDLHYRAIAGLGKKTIQKYQEEFVNRAWKQVEAVQSLNRALYQRILSIKVNASVKGMNYEWMDQGNENTFVARFMQRLSTMQNTKSSSNGKSLNDILKDKGVPAAFASATFQRVTDRLAQKFKNLNLTTMMENIAAKQIFKDERQPFQNLPTIEQLENLVNEFYPTAVAHIIKTTIGGFISFEEKTCNSITKTDDDFLSLFSKYGFALKRLNIVKGCINANQMANSAIPFFHLINYKNYISGCKNNNELYQKIRIFLDNHFDELPCFGSTDGSNPSLPVDEHRKLLQGYKFPTPEELMDSVVNSGTLNVVGLQDNCYTRLFGNVKPITKINTDSKSTSVYFVSIKKLYELRKTDNSLKESVKYYTNFIYDQAYFSYNYGTASGFRIGNNNTDFDLLINGSCIEYFSTERSKQSPNMYTTYNDLVRNTKDVTDCYHYAYYQNESARVNSSLDEFDSSTHDLYLSYRNKIKEYLLKTPDFISIDVKKLNENKYVQTFNSPYDYAVFLQNSEDVKDNVLIRELKKLKQSVEDLRKNFTITQKESEKSGSASEHDVNMFKDDVLDDRAYKRIVDVATDYYAEFFSDENKQNNYIEDLLQSRYPIMAYPIFPEPVYYYLNSISDKFIIPSAKEIPNNSVTMFENNAAFVEAYLCGMNTEMGRELLWREYPTDQRGSYFKKFWDSETDLESIRNDDFFDVKSLHTWKGKLGGNHCAGKDHLLMFAIRSDLVKLYPNTEIYLHKAKASIKDGVVSFDFASKNENNVILKPVSEAYMNDIFIVGFKISLSEALGTPNGPNQGYLLTFKQAVEDLAFKDTENEEMKINDSSAGFANSHIDTPSIIGRHILTFLKGN